MSPKYLKYLLIFCAFLAGGLFLSSGSEQEESRGQSKTKLLSETNPSEVSQLRVLRNGEAPLVLKSEAGEWRVDARDGYLADRDKVRALVLKLFDLPRTQLIPLDPSGFAVLGVDEKTPQLQTDIVELRSDSEKLASVILGQRRIDKQPDRAGRLSTSGQYVRLAGEELVYLSSLPVDINTTPSEWIKSDLLTVSEDLVFAVHQYVLLAGARQKEFTLTRVVSGEEAATEKTEDKGSSFALSPSPSSGEEAEEQLISQILAGLENVKIKDVAKLGETPVYDREIEFGLKSGLVYSIKSASREEEMLASVSVSFDEGLAAQIETSSPDVKDSDKIELASAEKAKELNDEFSRWIYTLAEYQAKKYRFLRTDLITQEQDE